MKTQKLAAILGVAALALGACGGKDKSGGGKGDYMGGAEALIEACPLASSDMTAPG